MEGLKQVLNVAFAFWTGAWGLGCFMIGEPVFAVISLIVTIINGIIWSKL